MSDAEETRPSVMRRKERNDALLKGALIALGALAIIDNIVGHWVLELHRVIPGEQTFNVEVALVVLGIILLVVGLWRELRAISLARVALAYTTHAESALDSIISAM